MELFLRTELLDSLKFLEKHIRG